MRIRLPNFKSLLGGDEIPRWIGLSLSALLVMGMGLVAYVGVREGKRNLEVEVASARSGTLKMLSSMLESVSWDNEREAAQSVLRSCAQAFSCSALRVVDSAGLVEASIFVEEIGTLGRPFDVADSEELTFRMPVASSTNIASPSVAVPETAPTSPVRFVEGVWKSRSMTGINHSSTASILSIFVVTGASFLLVYRKMRRHFLNMARISSQLVSRGEVISQDIQLLRLADDQNSVAYQQDLVSQWNTLVDLVADLSRDARRNAATEELKVALTKSNRGQLGDLLNVIPDGVMHVTGGSKLPYVNGMAKRLLGLPDDMEDKVALSSLSPSDTGAKLLHPVMNSIGADGSIRALSEDVEIERIGTTYRVKVLPFGKQLPYSSGVVVISDITQQVRADRAVEEFVSQVTHELRTPLTNISAYAETLSSGVFDDPQLITECYNVITKETRRLGRLIEDILSVAQLDSGGMRYEISRVDLRTLVSESVRDYRGLADESQVDVQVSVPSKLPEYHGDRDKLSIVLNNLLGNALKYTPKGGMVHVGCQGTEKEILISVKDTGIGIGPEDHDRIFEKFQRGSSAEIDEIQGTGIGLTTAREIARGHGGEIEVISAPGEGSTFIVHLPLNHIPNGSIGHVADEVQNAEANVSLETGGASGMDKVATESPVADEALSTTATKENSTTPETL